MSISFGFTLNAFGIFTLPIIEMFQCSHEQAARIATVFMVSMTLAMPAAGWLLDHVAPRPVMATGGLVTGLAYLAAAHSADLASFTAAIALCGAGVGASTYVPSFILVSHWFSPRRQGLAFGILLAVVAAGGTVLPIGLNRMVEVLGLRVAMQAGAVTILAVCVPLLLGLVRMPARASGAGGAAAAETGGRGAGEVLRMPHYWLWIAMFLLVTLSGLSILMGLVPYLVSVGYSAAQAAAAYGAIAAATIAGSLSFGALSTRQGAGRTLALGIVIGSIGLLCLLQASHPGFGLAAIVLFVLAWGTTFNLVNQMSPTLLMEFAGQRSFGSLLGIGNLISGLGAALGPMLFGHLVDTTKSYLLPVSLCAALMALALLPLAMLRRAPRRMQHGVAFENHGK
ncbi:MFS transporter [Thauera butanivorans]|uniref:MFS transporter n=1 Tax=Thauera butanivorans TaxID=86174 RepID=UPI00083943A4|nr:MFS transporter [Thauera butanivorans]